MNYKILALSSIIGVSVIGFSLMEAQKPPTRRSTARVSTVDEAAPESQFGFSEAMSSPWSISNEPAAPSEAPPPTRAISVTPDDADEISLPRDEIPVGLPQIAYVYAFGFRIAGPKIPALQQRHADLCESRGPQICRIIAMDQSGDEGNYARGTLQLAVASIEARAFGKRLATVAQDADGEQFASAISGEDLSKRIVDTEARLRARTLLRDRLMEVLATRRGTVTELVEAERGVAQVNEEIDQARSWLSEMKGRVAFSEIDITYEGTQPARGGGFIDPVRGAVGSLGAIFGYLIALLIVLGALAVPALAAIFGVKALRRKLGPEIA